MNRNVRKRTFGHVLPAKIQISLRRRAVWSESSLGAFWIANDAKFLQTDNEDSNQTARMRRLIWIFVGRTCQKVRFLTMRHIYFNWYTLRHVRRERQIGLRMGVHSDWIDMCSKTYLGVQRRRLIRKAGLNIQWADISEGILSQVAVHYKVRSM